MKKLIYPFFTMLIIIIILCNYNVEHTVTSPSATAYTESDTVEFVSVNITYEEQLGNEVVNKVRRGIEMFNPDVVKAFAEEGWKIAVLSEVNLEGTEYENMKNPITVGLTDYETKTIQVAPYGESESDFLTERMVHEFAHFADKFYNNAADTEAWKNLYKTYKDNYVEFEYYGIPVTEENSYNIGYATSNRWEFFACAMKDFYCHPDYVLENYQDVYEYMIKLTK